MDIKLFRSARKKKNIFKQSEIRVLIYIMYKYVITSEIQNIIYL